MSSAGSSSSQYVTAGRTSLNTTKSRSWGLAATGMRPWSTVDPQTAIQQIGPYTKQRFFDLHKKFAVTDALYKESVVMNNDYLFTANLGSKTQTVKIIMFPPNDIRRDSDKSFNPLAPALATTILGPGRTDELPIPSALRFSFSVAPAIQNPTSPQDVKFVKNIDVIDLGGTFTVDRYDNGVIDVFFTCDSSLEPNAARIISLVKNIDVFVNVTHEGKPIHQPLLLSTENQKGELVYTRKFWCFIVEERSTGEIVWSNKRVICPGDAYVIFDSDGTDERDEVAVVRAVKYAAPASTIVSN